MAVAEGIVDKAGAWYSYNNERLGQGRERVKQYLTEHPDFTAELEKNIRPRDDTDRVRLAPRLPYERRRRKAAHAATALRPH